MGDMAAGDAVVDDAVVAVVNGATLPADRLALVRAVDQVMSTLLGTEPGAPQALLDQLINHALVMEQMAAVEAPPPAADDVAARLDALLGAAGRSEADLVTALAAADVPRPTFDLYFAELIAVDGFARQAASQRDGNLDAYIAGLQRAARISYGPAAALSLAASAGEPPPTPSGAPTDAPADGVQTASPVSDAPPAALDAGPLDAGQPAPERGLAAGQLAPDFTLDTLGESNQSTFDDLLGKPLVLSFWTTWCPYCLRQTPVLVAAAERFAGDVRFVGIDVAEEPDVVAAYVAEHAIPYTILLDRESQAASAYAVNGFPTTYFLDATGHLIAQHIGSLTEEELTQYVEQLRRPRS